MTTNNVEEFIAVNFFMQMNEGYTCPCGLYVHPKRRNWNAIHIKDCVYYVEEVMTLYVEDLGIFGELRLTFDLDEQGLYNLKPEFFDADEGNLIATVAQIEEWLNNGGRERLQEYFFADAHQAAQEVSANYITVWYNGQEV